MGFKYSFSKQYNRTRLFDIDVEGLEYYSLEDIFDNEDTIWIVEGIYISTKGKFGNHPCAVVHNEDATFRGYVNFPQHMTDTCNSILSDDNAVDAINNGLVGFSIYRYQSKQREGDCYSIRWIDL